MSTHQSIVPREEESSWTEAYAAITRELDLDERREDPRRVARLTRRAPLRTGDVPRDRVTS
jgi:hypothetical protein